MFVEFKDFQSNFEEHKPAFDQIREYLSNLASTFEDIDFDKKEEYIQSDCASLSKDSVNNLYNKYVENELIKSAIVTSGFLKEYSKHFSDRNAIVIGKSDSFIKQEPGISFKPMSFSDLDLKKMWVSEHMTNMSKIYILNILSHLHTIGCRLYDIVNSPNIDISKFSKILAKEIDKMRKKIPRCNEAFDIIKDSVGLLENNFTQYYRDSIESENMSLIMESFISDVLVCQKPSSVLTHQFRKIIMFIKKLSAGNNDPMVKQLFGLLKNNFKLMEKYSPKEHTQTFDANEITKDKQEYEEMFAGVEEKEPDPNFLRDMMAKAAPSADNK